MAKQSGSESSNISTQEWLNRYYADYKRQIEEAGGTPVSREKWESHISGNSADIDPTAKAFLNAELDKIEATNATAAEQEKAKKQLEETQTANTLLGENLIGKVKGHQAASDEQLLKALLSTADQQFDLNKPEILEDLSARNLLHSSGVGTALAREKRNLNQSIANALMAKHSSDENNLSNFEKDIYSNATGLNEKNFGNQFNLDVANMQRGFSLDDYINNFTQATNMARTQSDATQKASENALWGDTVKTAAQLGLMAYMGGAKK